MADENVQANPGPGFPQHPGYKFDFTQLHQRVRVLVGGACIADTTHAVQLNEASYGPVYYIPRADVHLAAMVRTDHSTYCPFKGDASYWTLAADGAHPQGIAWSYETPFDESLMIKDYLAFYGDRVDDILIEPVS